MKSSHSWIWYDGFVKKILILILSLSLSGCSLFTRSTFTSQSITLSDNAVTKEAVLDRCVDGDTAHFYVDGKLQKVRFLSIDTPEVNHENELLSEPFGVMAADYTCFQLTAAKKLILESDPYENETDQYDRVLAWVWADGVLLNAQLVELGYAEVAFVNTTNLHSADLMKLQAQAQKVHLKIWKP